jgi:membrane protease YdiL (CAAX protease family)
MTAVANADERPRRYPWGPKQVGIGVLLAVGAFILANVLLVIAVGVTGSDFRTDDVPGPFEKARDVIEYADEKLAAASTGAPAPDIPDLLADNTALQIGLGTTFLYEVLLLVITVQLSGLGIGGFLRSLKLNRAPSLWRAGLVTIAAYISVVLYSVLINALDIDILRPQSTVPDAVARHNLTLVLAGLLALVGAPVAEETFFRGLMAGGLAPWGTPAALALSALAFTLAHGDPGSVIPFFVVGLALGWQFRRKGCLWDSITTHFMFNAVSFILLVALS